MYKTFKVTVWQNVGCLGVNFCGTFNRHWAVKGKINVLMEIKKWMYEKFYHIH